MATNTVRQMFDHVLEPVRGWFHDMALEMTAVIDDAVTFSPVPRGRVAYLNSSGKFQMGAPSRKVPMFLMKNSDDADVFSDNDPSHGIHANGPQVMTALVALGHFQISTTEYDSNQSYAINDFLVAQQSDVSSTTGGVLTNSGVVAGQSNIVGIVAMDPDKKTAVATNKHGANALNLWTWYLPPITALGS